MWTELINDKKAFIFDLDGTIIDSMWVWKQVDIDFFARYGRSLPEDYQDSLEGLSLHETAILTRDKYGIDEDINTMIDIWSEMALDKYMHEVALKEGFYDFLMILKEKGKKIGLATSNSRRLCMTALDAHGVSQYFDSIITSDEKNKGKPDPGIYLLSAQRLGVTPDECLVFEDLYNGVLAAKNAGMYATAIWDDYSKNAWEDKCSLADINIMNYTEIMDEICKS